MREADGPVGADGEHSSIHRGIEEPAAVGSTAASSDGVGCSQAADDREQTPDVARLLLEARAYELLQRRRYRHGPELRSVTFADRTRELEREHRVPA